MSETTLSEHAPPLHLIVVFWATSTALYFLGIYGAYTSAPNKALLFAFMTMQITMLLVIGAIQVPSVKTILTSERAPKPTPMGVDRISYTVSVSSRMI